MIQPIHSKSYSSLILTDVDFADKITLISNIINKAQLLFQRVEKAIKLVGLHVNDEKTEYMVLNEQKEESEISNC